MGDLALFLYGMNSMSDALQKAAGERMKKPQDRITDYISKMFASGNLTETQAEQTAGLLVINNNVDRIADRCQEMNSFIEKMDNTYDTVIGERGVGLSGGQKQRISIARALAKNTPILVMDDSTSALDMETEHEIQKTLHGLNHTTKLIIAHRISAVRHADEIIVLENGSIHERGTHEELMQKRGLYYATYLSQYGAYTAPGVADSHKKEA